MFYAHTREYGTRAHSRVLCAESCRLLPLRGADTPLETRCRAIFVARAQRRVERDGNAAVATLLIYDGYGDDARHDSVTGDAARQR